MLFYCKNETMLFVHRIEGFPANPWFSKKNHSNGCLYPVFGNSIMAAFWDPSKNSGMIPYNTMK
jgi:hypothetical protein